MVLKKTPRFMLSWFIALAFIISWGAFCLIELVSFYQPSSVTVLFFLERLKKAGWTLSALVITGAYFGLPGIRFLLKKLLHIDFSRALFFTALLLPLMIGLLSLAIVQALHPSIILSLDSSFINVIWLFLGAAGTGVVYFFLLGGGLGEELGLRGFLLPRIHSQYSLTVTSLFIGIVWALWHAPAFLANSLPNNLIYIVFIITLSFGFTAVFMKSNGSVVVVALLHASYNGYDNFLVTLIPELNHHTLWRVLNISFISLSAISYYVYVNRKLKVRHKHSNTT